MFGLKSVTILIFLVLVTIPGGVVAATKLLSLPFIAQPIITSGWIYDDSREPHRGIDYVLPLNHPVLAAADGIAFTSVQPTDSNGNLTYGTFVLINHENGYSTLYAHLSSVVENIKSYDYADRNNDMFSEWTEVKKGDVIGFAGNSGTIGVHLHFEVAENNLGTFNGHFNGKTDPYAIKNILSYYPPNGVNFGSCGQDFLWTECPPLSGPQPGLNVGSFIHLPYMGPGEGGWVVEEGDQTALVTDGAGYLFRMDLTNGSLTELVLVEPRSTGCPALGSISILNGGNVAVVVTDPQACDDGAGISLVNLINGNVVYVTSGLPPTRAIAIESSGDSLLATGFRSGINRVNLTTGIVTPVSSFSGNGIVIEAGGMTALVTAKDVGVAAGIYRVDLTSGVATLILPVSQSPDGLVLEETGSTAIFSYGFQFGVFRADFNSGTITSLSSEAVLGKIALSQDGSFVLVQGKGLVKLDIGTGFDHELNGSLPFSFDFAIVQDNLTVVVPNSFGIQQVELSSGIVRFMEYSDFDPSGSPRGIAMEDSQNTGLIAFGSGFCNTGQLVRVDVSTGQTSLVTSDVAIPAGVDVGENGAFAYSIGRVGCNPANGALYEVNLTTNTVSILPIDMESPSGIKIEQDGLNALVGSVGTTVIPSDGLSRVDLQTGAVQNIVPGINISPNGIEVESIEKALVASGNQLFRVDLQSGDLQSLFNVSDANSDACGIRAVGIEMGGSTALVSSGGCGLFRVRIKQPGM